MKVACGLIIKNEKILVAQRPLHKSKGGLWEFPGGQIENNESPEKALCRELKEELNLNVKETLLDFLGSLTEPDMTLYFFAFKLTEAYLPKEHRAVSWTFFEDISLFSLCPHDLKATLVFSEKIQKLCSRKLSSSKT